MLMRRELPLFVLICYLLLGAGGFMGSGLCLKSDSHCSHEHFGMCAEKHHTDCLEISLAHTVADSRIRINFKDLTSGEFQLIEPIALNHFPEKLTCLSQDKEDSPNPQTRFLKTVILRT